MLMVHSAMAAMTGAGGPTDVYGGADVVLDFAGVRNDGAPFFRLSGTPVASAAAAGFPSNAGAVNFPGDWAIVTFFSMASAGLTRRLWYLHSSGVNVYINSGGQFGVNGLGIGDSLPSSTTRLAVGRTGGLGKVSANGAATSTGGFVVPALNSQTLYIGKANVAGQEWNGGISMVLIFYRGLSDGELQTLASA